MLLGDKKQISFVELDKLCELQCTGEEIASFFDIDYDTLNARIKEEFNITFSEYFDKKRGKGKVSLRRKQWQKAMDGDTTMLIFLGKQHLDQSDKTKSEIESYNTNENKNIDLSHLTIEELKELLGDEDI